MFRASATLSAHLHPPPRAQAQAQLLVLSRALEHNLSLSSCSTQGTRSITSSSSSSSQTPADGTTTTTTANATSASSPPTIPPTPTTLSTSSATENSSSTTISERPIRTRIGGQNLTERYKRLERSVRGKEALARFNSTLSSDSMRSIPGNSAAASLSSTKAMYFRGFEIPQEPHPPQSDECCMSSCAICVYDLYDESMSAYKSALSHLRISLRDAGVPESEWPASIQTSANASRPKTAHEVSINAFEEMERKLRDKKQSSAAAEDARTVASQSRPKQFQNPKPIKNLQEAYEGMKWVLFSNR